MTAQNYDPRLALFRASIRFLSTLHRNIGRNGKMPNWLLADFQIDEIVAYILSLKDGRASNTF